MFCMVDINQVSTFTQKEQLVYSGGYEDLSEPDKCFIKKPVRNKYIYIANEKKSKGIFF